MKRFMLSVVMATTMILSNPKATHASLEDFDATPFAMYTNIQPGELKTQKLVTEFGRVSILRSTELRQDLPTAVFIHSNSGCKETFVRLFEHLTGKCNIVAVDLMGHGQSDNAVNPEDTYSPQGYARPILDVLHQLGVKKFTPVGWSLGGHVAMEMMYLSADRLDGVITTGSPAMPNGIWGQLQAFKVFRMWWAGVLPMIGQPTEFTEEQARFFLEAGGIAAPCPFFVSAAMRTAGLARATMTAHINAGTHVSDQQQLLLTSEVPVGIVIGLNDAGVHAPYIQSWVPYYQNATALELNTDHGAVWNEPKAFADFVIAFLKKNSLQSQ